MDVKFDVGSWQVSRVEEWSGGFTTPEQLFPEYDAAYFATVRDALRPDHLTHDGIIEAVFQVWVARRDGLTVLIDTGAGNDKERPGLPSVGGMTTPFLARLGEAGVAREDVDLVVCTHLHVDHVGWNTMLIDGRWVPTFPNARYVFPAIDRDVWDPAGPHFATMRGPGSLKVCSRTAFSRSSTPGSPRWRRTERRSRRACGCIMRRAIRQDT